MNTKTTNKTSSSRTRKVSLPASSGRSKINIKELRRKFIRQASFPANNDFIEIRDPMGKAQESFPHVMKKTGITFSETMYEHFCIWDRLYPENPDRLKTVYQRCVAENLISRCEDVPGRLATNDELETCHSKSLIQLLKEQETNTLEDLKEVSTKYDSIYINQATYQTASWAAGSTVELTKAVLEGTLQNAMAFVRPPGHHAMRDDFCGYSFFNNAAIAAKMALKRPDVKKILIVDWDVHHGQATQREFYGDNRVLYFSMHRYEYGHFWPNLRESDVDFTGEGLGKGFNFNIPLNSTGMKNEDYLAIFHQVLLPVAYEFNPDFILVSAGFDSAYGDPKGLMCLSPAVYGHLTSQLMALAEGKLVVILEGGYFPPSMEEGVAMTLRALLGTPCSPLVDELKEPCECLQKILRSIINIQKPYWKCFRGRHFSSEQLYSVPSKHPASQYPEKSANSIFPIEKCYPLVSEEKEKEILNQLARLRTGNIRREPPNRVCIVYDSFMEKHCPERGDFPELPRRTQGIMKVLEESKILARLHQLQSRRARQDELSLVHRRSWLDTLYDIPKLDESSLDRMENFYCSIYFNKHTTRAAELAVGCLLNVVDSVCTGTSRSGIAVIRPPGHHAHRREPSGFCIVNNVAVAAKYALKQHSIKKILIVDWDVHHGDGIQQIFEKKKNVLYISIHRYGNGTFFPQGPVGNLDRVGLEEGEGFNINIPWRTKGRKDGDYISAFTRVVLPAAYQFNPDLVLVSAGFDAAINDPLGACKITPECFGHMTHLLMPLASGKVILALEGGYCVDSISHSMAMCAKALLGDPLPRLGADGVYPEREVTETINEVIDIQKKYWPILLSDTSSKSPSEETPPESETEFVTPPESPVFHTPMKQHGPIEDLTQKLSEASVHDNINEASGPGVPDEQLLYGAMAAAAPPPMGEVTNGDDEASKALVLQMMSQEQMFAVVPLTWCPHLEDYVKPLPQTGLSTKDLCHMCRDGSENWVCLTCYKVFCGRFVEGHMLKHGRRENHLLVLSYSDLSVWCYECESYIDNACLDKAKEVAAADKFGC